MARVCACPMLVCCCTTDSPQKPRLEQQCPSVLVCGLRTLASVVSPSLWRTRCQAKRGVSVCGLHTADVCLPTQGQLSDRATIQRRMAVSRPTCDAVRYVVLPRKTDEVVVHFLLRPVRGRLFVPLCLVVCAVCRSEWGVETQRETHVPGSREGREGATQHILCHMSPTPLMRTPHCLS